MAIVEDEVFLNSLISNINEDTLSSEDLAWADSCLNKDVGASDTDWVSVKDALLEILSSQPEPLDNSSVAQSTMQLTAGEANLIRETFSFVEFGRGSDVDEDLMDGDDVGEVESIDISEDDEEDLTSRNKRGRVRRKVIGNVFRPNYSEDVNVENIDSDMNSSLTTYEVDHSSEDIFKVWDLGISEEQDDFTKQLNKALADAPSQIQSTTNDSAALMHVSVDDLIAGIGDLSLKQNTK